MNKPEENCDENLKNWNERVLVGWFKELSDQSGLPIRFCRCLNPNGKGDIVTCNCAVKKGK